VTRMIGESKSYIDRLTNLGVENKIEFSYDSTL